LAKFDVTAPKAALDGQFQAKAKNARMPLPQLPATA
jgi:hypothetical protein